MPAVRKRVFDRTTVAPMQVVPAQEPPPRQSWMAWSQAQDASETVQIVRPHFEPMPGNPRVDVFFNVAGAADFEKIPASNLHRLYRALGAAIEGAILSGVIPGPSRGED